MLTGLPNPKAKFLLGAGLEVLHHESQEWLATIEFWKDELRFFAEVLYWKEPKEVNVELFQSLLHRFEELHPQIESELEEQLTAHEKYLSNLMKNEKGSNWEYRDQHESIRKLMHHTTAEYKAFKNDVFAYVKLQ